MAVRSSRAEYVVKRVLFAFLTVFIIVTIMFFIFRLAPGNPLSRLGGKMTPQDLAQLKHELGLDGSIWTQYTSYWTQLLQGNMGRSYVNSEPVTQLIWNKLAITIPMVLIATVISILLGIGTGVLAAARRNTAVDRLTTSVALVFYSFPTQWFGLMLILLLGSFLPTYGRVDPFSGATGLAYFADVGAHMLLPAATLALGLYGEYTVVVRSAMLETLGEDYVLTARAKGLSRRRIVWRHAFRNASLPVVTLVALSLAYVVAGSILVEAVFSWPGIGLQFYKAIVDQDWPVLQASFLVLCFMVIFGNLAADLLLFKLDPRVTE